MWKTTKWFIKSTNGILQHEKSNEGDTKAVLSDFLVVNQDIGDDALGDDNSVNDKTIGVRIRKS